MDITLPTDQLDPHIFQNSPSLCTLYIQAQMPLYLVLWGRELLNSVNQIQAEILGGKGNLPDLVYEALWVNSVTFSCSFHFWMYNWYWCLMCMCCEHPAMFHPFKDGHIQRDNLCILLWGKQKQKRKLGGERRITELVKELEYSDISWPRTTESPVSWHPYFWVCQLRPND